MSLQIKWNKNALLRFDNAIKRIEQNSPQNAEKVKKEILLTIDSLLQHPEKFNPDKYKSNNDGSFRAFELYRYRISYRLKANDIRITRIRHTGMNPLEY
jgi:plasmid stabilization system protein ParE